MLLKRREIMSISKEEKWIESESNSENESQSNSVRVSVAYAPMMQTSLMTHVQTLRLHDGPDYSTCVDITAMTHHTFFSQIEISVCADTSNMYDRLPYLMIYSITCNCKHNRICDSRNYCIYDVILRRQPARRYCFTF